MHGYSIFLAHWHIDKQLFAHELSEVSVYIVRGFPRTLSEVSSYTVRGMARTLSEAPNVRAENNQSPDVRAENFISVHFPS